MIKFQSLLLLALIAIVSDLNAQTTSSLVVVSLTKINTPEQELSPFVSADDSTLYLTREDGAAKMNHTAPNKLYRARRTADGSWGKAEEMPGFEHVSVFGAVTMDSAGEMFISYQPAGNKNGDLDIGQVVGNTIVNIKDLNSDYWDAHPSISGNGKEMYITSNRLGPKDPPKIFVSHRLGDKSWTPPAALDSRFNYGKFSGFPFISADAKLLIFGSAHDEHGIQLYASQRGNGGAWSEPVLLPKPINIPCNNTFSFLTRDGHEFYFASDRPGGMGKMDIYEVKLPNGVGDLFGTH